MAAGVIAKKSNAKRAIAAPSSIFSFTASQNSRTGGKRAGFRRRKTYFGLLAKATFEEIQRGGGIRLQMESVTDGVAWPPTPRLYLAGTS